jgi:hypothetical protein
MTEDIRDLKEFVVKVDRAATRIGAAKVEDITGYDKDEGVVELTGWFTERQLSAILEAMRA